MNRLVEAEAFTLVVEKGSFTAAAKRLGVSTSYLSKLITRLEDRLGVRLLMRSTRKLSLTEAGRGFYERCSETITALEQAEWEAAQHQQTPRGRLRISLPTAFAEAYLGRPLAQFKVLYPELTIEAILSERRVDLVGEGFDLALRAGELPSTSLVVRRLANAVRIACASESYLQRRGHPREPEELGQHECLRYAYHAAPSTWTLHGPRGRVAVKVSGSLVSNHVGMLIDVACEGQGIVFAPEFFVASALREGRLRQILRAWRAPAPIQVVFPEKRHVSVKVRVLVDFLVDHFGTPAWTGWEQSALSE